MWIYFLSHKYPSVIPTLAMLLTYYTSMKSLFSGLFYAVIICHVCDLVV
jgi:hypothetical protein